MREVMNEIIEEDLSLGYKPVKTGRLGFFGDASRHGFLGEKKERWMLQISGERAQRTLKLMKRGDSCTRLDIQVTVQIAPGAVNRWLDAAENEGRQSKLLRNRRDSVKARHGADGNETVYLGSPKSDVYVRLYDKFRESGKEEYKDCVRLEVELKGKAARRIWEHCAAEGLGTRYLVGVLFWFLNQRGITTDWIETDWSYVRPPKAEPSKESVLEGWWWHQVAPSVARYSEQGRWEQALRIIFGKALTETAMSAILSTASLAYGN